MKRVFLQNDNAIGRFAAIFWLGAGSMLIASGCSGRAANEVARPLPIPPAGLDAGKITAPNPATCGKSSDTHRWSEIAELVLVCVSENRDFREPTGPDGYLLQVIPLDSKYHSHPVIAQVQIWLYSNPPAIDSLGNALPIRHWSVGSDQIQKYWRHTALLDGYLLPLDWGDPAIGAGNYLFVVAMNNPNQPKELTCQQIPFQDSGAPDITSGTSTSPAASQSSQQEARP